MNFPRCIHSPLFATAVVLGGLALLAVPLHRLTSAVPPQPPAAPVAPVAGEISAVVRVKLLAPARGFQLATLDGRLLWRADALPAGECEHDVTLALDAGALDLALRVDFPDGAETAVFVTLLPDGHEEQTRFATGAGLLEETLHFEWPHPQ
jgi:hypothetical protein